jgi:hypothetical protein
MDRDIRETNCVQGNGVGQAGVIATVSPARGALPLRRRRIRVEVEIPEGLIAEFDLMVQELLAGPRTRLTALERRRAAGRGAPAGTVLDAVRL